MNDHCLNLPRCPQLLPHRWRSKLRCCDQGPVGPGSDETCLAASWSFLVYHPNVSPLNIYIFKCVYTYIYIFIHCTSIYTYTVSVYIYTQCIYVYIYMCVRVCMYVYMCIYLHIYIYVCVCVPMYMHIHIYRYIYVYIYIHMYIYIYGAASLSPPPKGRGWVWGLEVWGCFPPLCGCEFSSVFLSVISLPPCWCGLWWGGRGWEVAV